MKHRIIYLPLVLCLLFTIGCCKVCHTSGKMDLKKEKAVLFEVDSGANDMCAEKGHLPVLEMLLADDAIYYPHEKQPIFGKEAILEFIKSGDIKYRVRWQPKEADVAESGDMGWTWGTSQVTFDVGLGDTKTYHSKYVNVWVKDKNGQWKLKLDIANLNPEDEDGME